MTNELSSWINAATGAVEQMQRWPSAILIIAVLIVCGGALKMLRMFPNRFIPIVVLVLGCALNYLLGDFGSVSHTQRHPGLVLGMQGMLLGFAAWALHSLLLKRFERFVPFLAGHSGDTELIRKTDEPFPPIK